MVRERLEEMLREQSLTRAAIPQRGDSTAFYLANTVQARSMRATTNAMDGSA